MLSAMESTALRSVFTTREHNIEVSLEESLLPLNQDIFGFKPVGRLETQRRTTIAWKHAGSTYGFRRISLTPRNSTIYRLLELGNLFVFRRKYYAK